MDEFNEHYPYSELNTITLQLLPLANYEDEGSYVSISNNIDIY